MRSDAPDVPCKVLHLLQRGLEHRDSPRDGPIRGHRAKRPTAQAAGTLQSWALQSWACKDDESDETDEADEKFSRVTPFFQGCRFALLAWQRRLG
jgi:hypothetical protein